MFHKKFYFLHIILDQRKKVNIATRSTKIEMWNSKLIIEIEMSTIQEDKSPNSIPLVLDFFNKLLDFLSHMAEFFCPP